ncbi:hypothetical protein ABIC63_005973 [Pseudacidovorax sp. 1753]
MTELRALQPAGQLQAQPGGVHMSTAVYGARMLRPGFLYLRIKRIGVTAEWQAYVVHPHGYLTAFDPHLPEDAKASPACEVQTRGAVMSLIWLQDARNVKSLHYLFHPDPLSWDHLKRHIEPHRNKYMQRFDVAGWMDGNTAQADTCLPDDLAARVLEFAALDSLAAQAVGCEQHYGLMGTHGAERDWGDYSEARFGRHFEAVRHETHDADGHVAVTDFGAAPGMAVGPYVAQVRNIRYEGRHGPRLKRMAELLRKDKGAVIACEDALGIAQELALHHLTAASDYVAWLAETDPGDTLNPNVTNAWKQAASECINTVEAAIYKRAMQVYDDETERLRQVREAMDRRHAHPLGTVMQQGPDGSLREVDVKELEARNKSALEGQIGARESDRRLVSDAEAANALRVTRAHYDVAARRRFDDLHLAKVKARDARMNGITEDLIAWLRSAAFLDRTLGRYDRTPEGISTGDGARCAGQLCAVLEPMDSTPRGRRWYAELQLFKDEPANLVWRMATLNNDQISDELKRVLDQLHDTVPPATVVEGAASAEESARRQQAWAAMGAALGQIPRTIKGSQTIIGEIGKVLDGNTSLLQKFRSLQKIADTARKNVHTVWCVAVVEAAKKAPPSQLERLLARGQVLILAHGLGEKAIDYVKDEERRLAEEMRAAGNPPVYSNKRNPEPGSRAWNRKYGYQGEKLQARTERAVARLSDSKVQNLRIPSALAALEVVGLLPTFGRAANRQDDSRAGSQAAGAMAAATGTLKGWRADFYEKNVLEEIKAKIPAHKWSAELGKATSAELQAMKIGAAHWVAAGAVVGVIWDAVDAITAYRRENGILMFAYVGRAVGGSASIITGLVTAYNLEKLRVVLWCARINIAIGIATFVMSEVIARLKEKEWKEWLQAEPFRKSDSKINSHQTEALMLSALGNAIADMER